MSEIMTWVSETIPVVLLAIAGWFGIVDPVARWLWMLLIPCLAYIAGSRHVNTSRAAGRMYSRFKVKAQELVKR